MVELTVRQTDVTAWLGLGPDLCLWQNPLMHVLHVIQSRKRKFKLEGPLSAYEQLNIIGQGRLVHSALSPSANEPLHSSSTIWTYNVLHMHGSLTLGLYAR